MKKNIMLLFTSVFICLGTHEVQAEESSFVHMAPIITYLLSDSTTTLSGLDKIKAYADDNTQPVPTIQDYEDAGVVGVTLENIDEINDVVASLTSIDVDTTEKVQAIVNEVNANTKPVADAGADQNVSTASTVTLDGSQSSDEDDDLLTYKWSIKSKPDDSTATLLNTSIVDPTFVADLNGSYVVELVVNDSTIDSDPDSVTIQAEIVNIPPTADAGSDQNVMTGILTTLDGSLSSDVEDDPLTYSWSFVSVPSGSALTILVNADTVYPAFIPDVEGEYDIQLIINDGTNDSIPAGVKVTVTPATTPEMQIKKTEQTKSYDDRGEEVTDGSLKDDGFYQTGVSASYGRDDTHNIVTDHITGLIWQDDIGARTVKGTWSNAVAYCDALTLGGYHDWRVPTIVELQSIMVPGTSPGINTSVFLNVDLTDSFGGRWYWSSSIDVHDTVRRWEVNFEDADVGTYSRYTTSHSIRCVR